MMVNRVLSLLTGGANSVVPEYSKYVFAYSPTAKRPHIQRLHSIIKDHSDVFSVGVLLLRVLRCTPYWPLIVQSDPLNTYDELPDIKKELSLTSDLIDWMLSLPAVNTVGTEIKPCTSRIDNALSRLASFVIE